ncbi:MAG: hypothetical protein FWG81_08865 [Betaproteobacteria bacterium]|nr:hypothetical protein [Betaproteobacteria bacterium]
MQSKTNHGLALPLAILLPVAMLLKIRYPLFSGSDFEDVAETLHQILSQGDI